MWADEAVFYQIYPLGFTGAPMPNDGVCVNRIQKVKGWIPHLKKLHIGAVYPRCLNRTTTATIRVILQK